MTDEWNLYGRLRLLVERAGVEPAESLESVRIQVAELLRRGAVTQADADRAESGS